MQKLFVLLLISLFLFGCGAAATQSEFWKHDAMYKSWDHMKFSMWEHEKPSDETVKNSLEQGWWGIEIPYIPAE